MPSEHVFLRLECLTNKINDKAKRKPKFVNVNYNYDYDSGLGRDNSKLKINAAKTPNQIANQMERLRKLNDERNTRMNTYEPVKDRFGLLKGRAYENLARIVGDKYDKGLSGGYIGQKDLRDTSLDKGMVEINRRQRQHNKGTFRNFKDNGIMTRASVAG